MTFPLIEIFCEFSELLIFFGQTDHDTSVCKAFYNCKKYSKSISTRLKTSNILLYRVTCCRWKNLIVGLSEGGEQVVGTHMKFYKFVFNVFYFGGSTMNKHKPFWNLGSTGIATILVF